MLVNDVTLCESVWVVGTAYRADKKSILAALQSLLDTAMFAFEHRATVQQAMQSFAAGKAGFADCLILARNRRLGCTATLTFDKALARHDGAEWLGGGRG